MEVRRGREGRREEGREGRKEEGRGEERREDGRDGGGSRVERSGTPLRQPLSTEGPCHSRGSMPSPLAFIGVSAVFRMLSKGSVPSSLHIVGLLHLDLRFNKLTGGLYFLLNAITPRTFRSQ